MLISPPFLPERGNDVPDAQWIEQAMVGGMPGQGGYPVSYSLGWHGGIHLEAPSAGVSRLPVRAIADGTVVYVRKPTEVPCGQEDDHPLNYRGGWTSDGCVVIKHETEIGAAANGTATQVTFYSITMHLDKIDKKIKQGKKVYRKDELGQAGYIYGDPYKIHFEIICDCTNVEKLVGRKASELDTSRDGRSDVIYGELYFKLPAWTEIYTTKPAENVVTPEEPSVHTLRNPLYVGIRYAAGDGAAGQRGHAFVTTYQEDGKIVGEMEPEQEAEYKLYASATKITEAYRTANARPGATQTPVPAPSAVYELLRFGRVIGPDALNPANTPHWRKISYGDGTGWVNLNAQGITKFSDADFPHWKNWQLIEDCQDEDSRCDSATIKGWLDEDKDGKVDPNEAVHLLSEERIQAKMRRTICKIPTEWQYATVDRRWNWLKQESEENPAPLGDEDFKRLKAHIEELSFWDEADIYISPDHWHFHPREFVKHFRICEWLSVNELSQCIPRSSLSGNVDWGDANSRATRHNIFINRLLRKYLGHTRIRHVHLLAQVYIETGLLSLVEEGGHGNNYPYKAFYGRGYMQLTWAGNYKNYGIYRGLEDVSQANYTDSRITATSTHKIDSSGTQMTWFPRYDPDIIASDLNESAESSGFFWVTKSFRGRKNINRVCDLVFSPTAVAFACWLINGGANGYAHRQQFAKYLANILLDMPTQLGQQQFSYPPLSPAQNPTLCAAFPPANIAYTLNGTINYERQIP